MSRNLAGKLEILLIVLLACIPLFIHFPYRVNIFLSWEGAYRMSIGQMPFRDYGIPLGGMYWVVPAFFFKIFGPKLITLVKAQVFINILSGLAFRSILISLAVQRPVRWAAVMLFCLSFSFFNFWPWYNHSVIVYELIGLAFLFRYVAAEPGGAGRGIWLPAVSAFFMCCSFLTKQDGGGMAVMIAAFILFCNALHERKWGPLFWYLGSFALFLGGAVLVFGGHAFGYWFNHGQPPHTARVSAMDILDEFFGASQWIKFYFFLIAALVFFYVRLRGWKMFLAEKRTWLMVLLAVCILGEAAILQVTSYTPPDNNIFFHSFAFACFCSLLAGMLPVSLNGRLALVLTAGILLWWSGIYWNYARRMIARVLPVKEEGQTAGGENVVNKRTYMISRDTVTDVPMEQWVESSLPSFHKIYMPAPTVDGINRLLQLEPVRRHREALAAQGGHSSAAADTGFRVLNMSELTPLAAEIPFSLERNPDLPLWFHLGVGMFNRQAAIYEQRVRDHYYDLVLFEYIPTLNNFYPFRVRDSLQAHYHLVDSFLAPRRGPETKGYIEVYLR